MKNIICLLIILFGSMGVYAQEKVLTQGEFDAVYQASRDAWSLENWKGKPFRLVTVVHSSFEGRPQTDYTSKSTIEYASPTSSRVIYERSLGDKKSKVEAIRLGGKNYFRKDGKDWKEGAPDGPASVGNAASDLKPVSEQIEYKFLGTDKLNNQTTRVYAKNVKTKRVNPTDGQETIMHTTNRYWLGEDGSLLKSEMISESRMGEKTYRTLMTQTWEPDESIKLVAPTLSAKQ